MAKRKSLADSSCPVARALDVIGDRWSLLIVRDAFDGARRFGEFQSGLGVARNILATRLRHLVEHGILAATPSSEGGAYHDYLLTPKGEALFGVVLSLRQWGEAQLYRRGEAHSRLLERASGKPLPRMQPLNRDGRALRAADTVVKKLP